MLCYTFNADRIEEMKSCWIFVQLTTGTTGTTGIIGTTEITGTTETTE